MANYDFSGWATRNNLKCSDGRTIMRDAFKENNGQTVPLVWNHQHNDPLNVLGHALLENRDNGVYAYCKFNETEAGQNAKLLVEHGDVSALSIYANQLRQQGANVLHGAIREVSLVLAGANPGAFIDSIMAHGEESDEEAIIYTGEQLYLSHGDDPEEDKKKKKLEEDDEEEPEDKSEEETEEQPEAAPEEKSEDDPEEEKKKNDKKEKKTLEHSEESSKEDNTMAETGSEKTVQDVVDSMSEEQKTVMYALIGQALEDAGVNSEGGNEDMKHNVFDQEEVYEGGVLSHADMEEIISDGKRFGSLKESFLAHAEDYGIENIDYLFPEAQSLNNPPEFIKRDTDWVAGVMSGVHHTPFSRIKSMFADITEDEARAKGYIKGNLKKEEVFSLLKRTTTPQTIYKKQKLDRDDVIDITDFDVVAWLKGEMRIMLDEEIARALLVGDGRLSSDDDKINEQNIRPIWKDSDLYTIKKNVELAADATDDEKAKAFIKAAVKSRKDYKGSGNPVLYTTEDVLTDCLLMEDKMGRIIYDSVDKLKSALRVSNIITVPVMEGLSREAEGKTYNLMGIIVNLADYNVGADKGGAVNMFDDFDIDYNAQKYLIETRCSGALTKPYAAIAIEATEAAATGGTDVVEG